MLCGSAEHFRGYQSRDHVVVCRKRARFLAFGHDEVTQQHAQLVAVEHRPLARRIRRHRRCGAHAVAIGVRRKDQFAAGGLRVFDDSLENLGVFRV